MLDQLLQACLVHQRDMMEGPIPPLPFLFLSVFHLALIYAPELINRRSLQEQALVPYYQTLP